MGHLIKVSKSGEHERLSVLWQATSRMAVDLCTESTFYWNKHWSFTGGLPDWSVGNGWSDGKNSWWRDKPRWQCGCAGLQHWGVHGEPGKGRKGFLLLLHLKCEGGLQWANFRCEEQKARFSPYTTALCFSQHWLDDEVSGWSPTEFHFDSLYLVAKFILHTDQARHSLLCIKQLNGAMLPICAWGTFRSISVLYNRISVHQYNHICHMSIQNLKSSTK